MSGGFDSLGFDFLGFDTDAASAVAPAVGHVPRRRRYIIDDNPIRLTNDELEAKLSAMLRDDQPTPKQIKRAVREAKPEDRPLVAAVPNFAAINAQLLARAQYEAAERLRQIAQRMADDEDEREVEMLLWG